MKRKLVWCLFFFSLIGCTGCMGNQEKEKKAEDSSENYTEEKIETLEPISSEYGKVAVLTDGKTLLTNMADHICEKMGAVHFDISDGKEAEMTKVIRQADYVLIGTDKNSLEFEFSIRKYLDEEALKGKKVSLFLVDQEEEEEVFEDKFKEWYPEAVLLPVVTMNSKTESFQDILGRINGWLTTVMTYDRNMN